MRPECQQMKEWYTNQELADLCLPGFPGTRKGIEGWFEKRDYDTKFPAKVRAREGRGGGIERHITLLPKTLQSLLTLRHLKVAEAPPLEETFAGTAEAVDVPANETGALRRDAILLVLNFWDIFRAKFGGSVESARHHFCTMYAAGRIEGIPSWVRSALTTKAGRERGFCVNTLRRWEDLRAANRIGGLVGKYGNRAGTGVLDTAEDGAVAGYLAALIVKHPSFSADQFKDELEDRFGETVLVVYARSGEVKSVPLPPIRTIQRWVAKWREDHQDVLMKMTDPDGWKNKQRFSGRNMNAWVTRPNQLWEIDASPADALLTDGRYAIYAVVDIYTRRMKVLVTKTPRTAATLALIRRTIMDWGVPEIIRTDNGSDFTSYEFRRAMSALGIHHDISDPFSPEQKGTVERHIGTIQRGLMPLLPGFIGHSVADRKKIEARKAFAQRLGESDKKAFCVELTHEQMQGYVDRWVEDKYHHRPHSGLGGRTPFQMLTSWMGEVRRIENERALDLMLAPISGKDGLRQVTKRGIVIRSRRDGISTALQYLSAALVVGDQVLCRQDPEDLGRLYIYSPDGLEFICVAECPELLGANPGEAVRAVREAQAERLRAEVRPLAREIARMTPTNSVDAVLRVAAKKAGNVVALPRPSNIYSTPALAAAADAAAEPAPAQTLSPQMQASVERLKREIAQGKTRNISAPPENPKDRYRHALSLQAMLDAGKTLPTPDDELWLKGYRTTSEYQTQRELHDEFGDMYIGQAATA